MLPLFGSNKVISWRNKRQNNTQFSFVNNNIQETRKEITLFNDIESFYILGDIGFFSTMLSQIVDRFRNDKNGKTILLGDNFYPNGIIKDNDSQWNKYKSVFYGIPHNNIYAIMGNHDYHANPSFQINSNYFENNEFYFKRTFGNSDFYFLDTVLLYKGHANIFEDKIAFVHNKPYKEIKEKQLKWFVNELQKSDKENRKKIVFGHYPILTNGLYTNYMKPLYNLLVPIFEKYNVNAYISGHEHNIQYIKRKINDYTLNQFVIGSSSEVRSREFRNPYHNDMYESDNNYYLQMYEKQDNIFFEFKNKYGIIKHSYVL